MDYRKYIRPLSEEDDDSDVEKNSDAPEYKFEGFSIEVNEKIALTPITPPKA